jgi:hypothetical protein
VESGALATLAVHDRPSSRLLLFDRGRLVGRATRGAAAELYATAAEPRELAFAGIHAVAPALLDRISESGAFSIIDVYLRLAREGERVLAHDITNATWHEIGNRARLEAARRAHAREVAPADACARPLPAACGRCRAARCHDPHGPGRLRARPGGGTAHARAERRRLTRPRACRRPRRIG